MGILLKELQNRDKITRFYKGIIISFNGKRRVLSTSVFNGGIRDDLSYAFNYNCMADERSCELHEESYEKELARNARDLEIDEKVSTGLSTAAWMERASIRTVKYEDLELTAVVTGGIDTNAVRVGDPASYYEKNGEYFFIKPGTINIMLHINAALPPGAMARCLVTATEAKTIAVEELFIGSNYSVGLATGSGTDGTIIISDLESKNVLTDAGEHSKLGEMIGNVVKDAVKEALNKHTDCGAARQHKLLVRTKRYGITMGALWEYYNEHKELFLTNNSENSSESSRNDDAVKNRVKDIDIVNFEKVLNSYNGNSSVVIWSESYVHILDQMRWNMLEWAEGIRSTRNLSEFFLDYMGVKNHQWNFILRKDEDTIKQLIEQLKYVIVVLVTNLDVFGM
ncbi:Adenosylcobinamide amidohydrolase [Acetitomaculum ruminis DSM 5522]|uniref:Adenosylcobinamide amidohydrolase n=1 Tax=Acetitomaculum ruminis DSM 5522 TaxID=1120918 RepID=A0A1I0VSB1_9FIRM|nr:adenosylcobinamide amidohydrolase [Acetitomaculum ruminis]SFA78833.1 Adenosylcobinamide amidohydrolase [Acetitomaculum ruminis DSM 5522]